VFKKKLFSQRCKIKLDNDNETEIMTKKLFLLISLFKVTFLITKRPIPAKIIINPAITTKRMRYPLNNISSEEVEPIEEYEGLCF
jgi:hypothetical protein